MFIAKLFGNSAYGNKDSFEENNTTKKTVSLRTCKRSTINYGNLIKIHLENLVTLK